MRGWRDAWSRWLLAVGGGVLLALAFPRPGWAGLAWVAPAGLLFAAAGTRGVAAFRWGYVGGLARHLVALGWLLYIPFPVGNVAAWLCLSGYLALFEGAWVWLCWRAVWETEGDAGSWLEALDGVLAWPVWRRVGWGLLAAGMWVGVEMVEARLFTGFPWSLAGSTQYAITPLIQVAAFTGVYGVSFLLVWVSISVALALLRVARAPRDRWGWMGEVRLPLLVVVGLGAYGVMRMGEASDGGRRLRLALVQPSIPQLLIWDEAEDDQRFEQVMRLSELALATRPDVLVWPESAMPAMTEERYQAITNLVQRHGVWMVFGADDAELRGESGGRPEYDYFNAAFLLNPEGRVEASYRKQSLVIFGEYVPLVRWLPFLRHFTPIQGGFTSGTGPVDFRLGDLGVTLSVLICFEDVFPPVARRSVRGEVGLLLNLTNNGWFGESSAQWQHAAAAVFRAVENGVPLVRATNNGLTCWVDDRGRMREWLGRQQGDVYGAGFLTVEVPVAPPGEHGATFYHRYGDVFGWLCLGVTLSVGGATGWRRVRRSRGSQPVDPRSGSRS